MKSLFILPAVLLLVSCASTSNTKEVASSKEKKEQVKKSEESYSVMDSISQNGWIVGNINR